MKANMDPDSDIDDLKQNIFDTINTERYQTTYNGQPLKPSTKVPQNTTDDMPIIFTKIPKSEQRTWRRLTCGLIKPDPPKSQLQEFVASDECEQPQEFAAPSTFKKLNCNGRPCAKCHKCRDWHFTGDQDTWNWVCNYKNWKEKDTNRWHGNGYMLFTYSDGDWKFFTKHDASCKLFTKRDDATCDHDDLLSVRNGLRTLSAH
ncbi:unnamed protein product, partial [Adineta steineri]